MFLPIEENNSLVEYAIIIALVAIIVVVALAVRPGTAAGGFSSGPVTLAGA